MLNIVLVEPEIPNNTGNIVRTCAVTDSKLHLIKPLGFSLEDKYLKRSGLDYWEFADMKIYENMQDFLDRTAEDRKGDCGMYYATTKAPRRHTDVQYQDNCYVFFGKETKGLPEELLAQNYDKCIRIPMRAETRSLNLANSVAIIAYEYLRQRNFDGLEVVGKLRGEFNI